MKLTTTSPSSIPVMWWNTVSSQKVFSTKHISSSPCWQHTAIQSAHIPCSRHEEQASSSCSSRRPALRFQSCSQQSYKVVSPQFVFTAKQSAYTVPFSALKNTTGACSKHSGDLIKESIMDMFTTSRRHWKKVKNNSAILISNLQTTKQFAWYVS